MFMIAILMIHTTTMSTQNSMMRETASYHGSEKTGSKPARAVGLEPSAWSRPLGSRPLGSRRLDSVVFLKIFSQISALFASSRWLEPARETTAFFEPCFVH